MDCGLSRLWTKVREILGRCRGPLVFSKLLPDALTSFGRYSPLSRRETEQMYKVLVPISWEGRLWLFYVRLFERFTFHRLAKFGWVPLAIISVCEAWQWSRMQNLRTVGKNFGLILSFCEPKFMTFWDDVGDPMHLPYYVYHVSFRSR